MPIDTHNKLQRAAVAAFQRAGYTETEAKQIVDEIPGSLRGVLRDLAAHFSAEANLNGPQPIPATVPAYAPAPRRLG